MAKGSSPQVRLNINISDRLKKDLEHLRDTLEVDSSADTIRLSISLMKTAIDATTKGGIIYLYDPHTDQLTRVVHPHKLAENPAFTPILLPRSEARRNAVIYSEILIDSIGELIDETRKRLGNTSARLERTDDTAGLLRTLRILLIQVKKLNSILTLDGTSKAISDRDRIRLAQHINKFLDGFAGVAGKGSGALVVTAGASLLTYIGMSPHIVSDILNRLR